MPPRVLRDVEYNYPSAGFHIRQLSELPGEYEVLETHGLFRIVRIAPPFFEGSELWVVNEKGFFWEPAVTLEAAHEYLRSPEAMEYQGG